jgi:hypothetical protein
MSCPLKLSANPDLINHPAFTYDCDKDNCGFWDEYDNCCAIVAISRKLTAQTGFNIAETIDRKLDRR